MDYINTHHYPTSSKTHEAEIWIGIGSRVDWECFEKSGLLEAMEKICSRYPQVRLVLSSREDIPATLNINSDQMKIYSRSSFEDWVGVLLSLDIGLLPIYGDYDLRLGSYDLLEFMISKIPWLASEEPTFRNFSHFGQWVPNTADDWKSKILGTIENLDIHQKTAVGEQFLFALNQDVSVNIAKVLKIYDTIINQ